MFWWLWLRPLLHAHLHVQLCVASHGTWWISWKSPTALLQLVHPFCVSCPCKAAVKQMWFHLYCTSGSVDLVFHACAFPNPHWLLLSCFPGVYCQLYFLNVGHGQIPLADIVKQPLLKKSINFVTFFFFLANLRWPTGAHALRSQLFASLLVSRGFCCVLSYLQCILFSACCTCSVSFIQHF